MSADPYKHWLFAFALASATPTFACAPFIEHPPTQDSARFRAHTDMLQACPVDEATYQRLTAAWLRSLPADAAPVKSLALGRAVDYPWLSRAIADAGLAKARHLRGNKLAAAVLRDAQLLKRLAVPFEGSAYEVLSLSYEKVLFGPANRHASDPRSGNIAVPFDAQLWLTLQRRK